MRSALSLFLVATMAAAGFAAVPAQADELTQRIQKDLAALGYEPGNVHGEATTETAIAISKFQAENGLEVTGQASPQLAGILSARTSPQSALAPATAAPVPSQDPAALQAAQQACLQKKIEEAQASQKKKRGVGRLLSAVSRTAYQTGNYDMGRTVNHVYSAGATADDLSAAAKDLGLSEDEVAACRDPS